MSIQKLIPPEERLLKISDVAKEVERLTGDRPHLATIHRWMSRGLCGVRLRSVFALGQRRVQPRWLDQFFVDVANAKNHNDTDAVAKPANVKSPRIADAERELASAGI